MDLWIVLVASGLLTFAIRFSFIFLLGRVETPLILQRALRFVPPSVLSAIIFQELVIRGGEMQLNLQNPRLLAGVFAGLIAWRTRNPLLTIALGMAALLVIELL